MRIGYINLKISLLIIFISDFPFIIELLQTIISLQNIEKMRKQRFYDINKRI